MFYALFNYQPPFDQGGAPLFNRRILALIYRKRGRTTVPWIVSICVVRLDSYEVYDDKMDSFPTIDAALVALHDLVSNQMSSQGQVLETVTPVSTFPHQLNIRHHSEDIFYNLADPKGMPDHKYFAWNDQWPDLDELQKVICDCRIHLESHDQVEAILSAHSFAQTAPDIFKLVRKKKKKLKIRRRR